MRNRMTIPTSVGMVILMLVTLSVPAAAQESMFVSLIDVAKAQQDYAVKFRREIHRDFTGTRWTPEETAILERIKDELWEPIAAFNTAHASSQSNAIIVTSPKGGMWVDITYDPSWDRILLRADVDALPVQEATGLPFSSAADGRMHACGHDTHIAMVTSATKVLLATNKIAKHNIRVVYQRAEENPVSKNGGQTLVEDDGVLEGVSKVYGLHIWVDEQTGQPGTFVSFPGPILANNDQFRIQVHATGGHGAMPNQGSNALDIAVDIHNALRGFDRRFSGLGPKGLASITPVVTLAGTAGQANVRPAYADIWYACRTFLDATGRANLAEALKQKVEATVSAYPDASVEYEFVKGYPVTTNDPVEVNKLFAKLKAAGFKTGQTRSLGSEDFSYYLLERPGAYFLLGAWQEGSGGHHSPAFNPDESVLWQGVFYWLLLATA